MVCGTTSDSGKSTVVTGLCRLLARRGVSVAPFKGQNMSLNSIVTATGGEIGRAQWRQALAAGAEPEVAMNPVLLKPSGDAASHVVVMGRPTGVQEAARYQATKNDLVGIVDEALADLRRRFDVVILEGAGSPAEINLLDNDIVNLGVARRNGIRAIVVGDIERGGVFAHLLGIVAILPDDLSSRIQGFVINRFRGDPSLLGDAARQLEAHCDVPTLGVLPYLEDVHLDAEDSLALARATGSSGWADATDAPDAPGAAGAVLDVAVIRLPRVSNFTDLDPFAVEPHVRVRWVETPAALGDPDLVVLPGSRSTASDLEWLRNAGLVRELEVLRRLPSPPVVLGLCGGYQMLGERVDDPLGIESTASRRAGLGWLPVDTIFRREKFTQLNAGTGLGGELVHGFEIRHGYTRPRPGWSGWLNVMSTDGHAVSARDEHERVFGTSLHGLFEEDGFRSSFLRRVASVRGRRWRSSGLSFAATRERQIDRIADACESHLDTDALWHILESG
jgi:adenosylcobyric acid synthase